MRALTHNRLSRTPCSAFVISALMSGWLLCGCTSVPKFRGPDDRLTHASAGPVPVPVFDDTEDSHPSSRIASSRPARGIVSAPEPFAWQPMASSAGQRDINGITIGQGGYRTVVLGSLAGHDPLALNLTEALASHLHENQIILGGIQVVVIRSPNPDGEAGARKENQNGVYLNRRFTAPADANDVSDQEPEVRFVQGLLSEAQPQRVIHIRTYDGTQGIVAASSGAMAVARDVSEWLGFRYVSLPGKSAEGTLERFVSQQDSCEIITFAIPQSADPQTLWSVYGDSLLNLLLDDDFETRRLARSQRKSTSADRRGRKHVKSGDRDD